MLRPVDNLPRATASSFRREKFPTYILAKYSIQSLKINTPPEDIVFSFPRGSTRETFEVRSIQIRARSEYTACTREITF